MTNTNVMEQKKEMTNGVDIGQIMDVIGAIEADPGYAKFQWRATNRWINGGNAGDTTRKEAFTLDADEPPDSDIAAAVGPLKERLAWIASQPYQRIEDGDAYPPEA